VVIDEHRKHETVKSQIALKVSNKCAIPSLVNLIAQRKKTMPGRASKQIPTPRALLISQLDHNQIAMNVIFI